MIKKPQQKQRVIIILGPTSAGKTALSIHLAKKFNGEVISADSRQVYKGLNLGTGKVTKREMANIPHHLLDVIDPKKQFSAADFKEQSETAIKDIVARGYLPIVAGGTGLYADTLAGTVILPGVPPNEKLRIKLEKYTKERLLKMLKKMDPVRAKNIEPQNKRRIIRAIEIAKTLGKVPKQKKGASSYEILWLGIDLPDNVLKQRIAIRIKERLRQGMVAEAKRLYAHGLTYKRMEALGLEYRYLAHLLKKRITKVEFKEQLNSAIWQYVKRQRRWFKRNKEIQWFSPKEHKKIEARILKFLHT